MQIKYGLDNMWRGMVKSTAIPTEKQIQSGLVTEYSSEELDFIQKLSRFEFNPLELAMSIVRIMRLFYRMPLEIDTDKLSSYLDLIQTARLNGSLRREMKIKQWSEFLISNAPPKLDATGMAFQESYIWAVLHFLGAYGTTDASRLLRYISLNLINLLQCGTCKMHLTMNRFVESKYHTNLLISIDSDDELRNTFFSTCQFQNDINDINKRVPANTCRACTLNCHMRKFPTSVALLKHREVDYRNRLVEYRSIIEMSDEEFGISFLN